MPTHRTPKTLAHQNDSAFSHPAVGQPFNFYALSTGVLILTPILSHPALSPGSRILWGVVRNWSKQKGVCHARIARFAAALGCSGRQISRYRSELEAAGLLLVEERPGWTWTWKLLWHPVFADASYAEGRRKRQRPETDMSGGSDGTVTTERSVLRSVLEVNTKNTDIVVGTSVVGSRKPTTKLAPNPARSDASKRAWKTAEKRAVQEATAAQLATERTDVLNIVYYFTATLPDEAMIDTVLAHLATARMTPAQLHMELEKRAEKLATPMRPPFVSFLAKQFATGKWKKAPPPNPNRRNEPERLVTYCQFCLCEYGSGNCAVTADGEILSGKVTHDLAVEQDPDFDKGGWIDCPVCVTQTESPEPTKGFDIGGAALRKL